MRAALLEGLQVPLYTLPTHQPLPPLPSPQVELLLMACRSHPPPL